MKNKALIIISSAEYIRNYIKTDAFDKLNENFRLHYLISNKISLDQSTIIKLKDFSFYNYDKKLEKLSINLFDTNMYLNQNKSKSFKFRLSRYKFIKTKNKFKVLLLILKDLITFDNQFLREYFKFERIIFLSHPIIYKLYLKYFNNKFRININLLKTVESINPDIIIFPTSAYEPISIDICRLCKKSNIKSLFLVDNWDNLSSKTILFEKPNFIAVWSQQALQHAISIQGFERERIFILGNPRFAHYFRERELELTNMFGFNYVLFVGTALSFDEANCLSLLDKIISKTNLDLKIIYRPHPWRQGKDTIVGRNLKNVIIDPQLIKAYENKDNSYNVQPDLNYYPSLISNSLFVIGGLTSMLIESLIFRKQFIALVYEEDGNITNPSEVYKNYTHFEGIENLSSVIMCDKINYLENKILEALTNNNKIDKDQVDKELDFYFSFNIEKAYNERLLDIVKLVCCE
jgi:hypothetical protein